MRGTETLSSLSHPWWGGPSLSWCLSFGYICPQSDISCLICSSVELEFSQLLFRTRSHNRLRSVGACWWSVTFSVLRIGHKCSTNPILRLNNISLGRIGQLVIGKMGNMHILLMFYTLFNSLPHIRSISHLALATLLFIVARRSEESGFGDGTTIFARFEMLFMFILFRPWI